MLKNKVISSKCSFILSIIFLNINYNSCTFHFRNEDRAGMLSYLHSINFTNGCLNGSLVLGDLLVNNKAQCILLHCCIVVLRPR